jgi:hypothetical protein
MTPIPLAKTADPTQVERVRELLADRACVVVGSAPLTSKHADVQPGELAIPVNGGISSLAGAADLWVVNSKAQDAPGMLIRPLHKLMLEQASGRTVGHLLMLRGPKVMSEQGTLATLKALRCRHNTWSVLDKPTKRWLEGELCARVDDKKPCSSGILAVAIALYCGAASVRLVGFSFTEYGYHYPTKEKPASWWRDHVTADRRALAALQQRYGRLSGEIVQREVAA